MAVTGFNQMLQSLAGVDFFSGVLPFIVTYVLFFFVLQGLFDRMEVIPDDKNTTLAAIVAIAFAFYTARFIFLNPVFQDFFLQYMGRVSLIIVGLLGLLVVLAFVGYDLAGQDGDAKLLGWILLVIALGAFWVSGGMNIFFPSSTQSGLWNTVLAWINFGFESGFVWVLVVIALLIATMRGETGSDDNWPQLAVPIGGNGNGGNDDT